MLITYFPYHLRSTLFLDNGQHFGLSEMDLDFYCGLFCGFLKFVFLPLLTTTSLTTKFYYRSSRVETPITT